MSHDPQCHDLAEFFLRHRAQERTTLGQRHVDVLADRIQEVVEDYLAPLTSPHSESKGEDNYITVKPAMGHGLYNVVIMHWDDKLQEHVLHRCSVQLSKPGADALARSWASAERLEVR